jgi:hypothetical protein
MSFFSNRPPSMVTIARAKWWACAWRCVEGFHEEPQAKIAVLADRKDEPLCKMDRHLLAFVTPSARQTALPTFAPGTAISSR